MSAQLWDTQARRPVHWVALSSTEAYRARHDFLHGDLRPNAHIVFMDQPLTTNRWGMRDRDRELAKPAGTYRIAVLGPSHVMGTGVADGETFTLFLEERLNRSAMPETKKRYEVLNFGFPDYSLLQQLAMLEERALMFQPDAVFITDSHGSKVAVIKDLSNRIAKGIAIPYPDLEALARKLGVNLRANSGYPVPFEGARALLGTVGIKTRMLGREVTTLLRPAGDSLVRWTLERMAAVIRGHGAVPVFVALNNVMDPSPEWRARPDAAAAGFLVFNLLELWQNRDKSALRVAEWDNHPNAAGHRLIANRLFELMQQHRSELRLEAAEPQLTAQTIHK
jgi:hypothetical protein